MSNYRPTSTFSNPVTKVGRVVFNVSLDMNHAAYRQKPAQGQMYGVPNVRQDADEYTLTIQPHEICLEQDKTIFKRTMARSVNDTEILLLSALNGLKCARSDISPNNPEETRRNIRRKLKFGGVASTMAKYDPDHRVQNDQVFVSQFGGLCTIQNTGSEAIRAGDFVVWDLPKTTTEGTMMSGKKEKQMVITRPYRHNPIHCKQVLRRRLQEGAGDYGKAMQALQNDVSVDSVSDVLYQAIEDLNEERGRIIGRAMSNAERTGDTFDILLGRYAA